MNDTFSEDIQNLNSIDAYENSSIHTTSVSELENDDQVSENGQYIIRQACSYTFSGNMKSITSENENEASEVCLEVKMLSKDIIAYLYLYSNISLIFIFLG